MANKLKRPIAFMAAVAMIFSMLLYLPSGTFSNTDWGLTASAYTEGYFRYEVSEEEGCIYITEYFGREDTVTVPNMIAFTPIYGINGGVFSSASCVKTIYLPDTVGYIAEDAFSDSQTVMMKFPQNLTNMTSSYTEKYIERNKEFTATFTADEGYTLPSSITIYRYTTPLVQGKDYTYNSSTGELTIFANSVDIPLSISAEEQD